VLFLISADFIAADYCWGVSPGRGRYRKVRNPAIPKNEAEM
jgi:hypothetical protein